MRAQAFRQHISTTTKNFSSSSPIPHSAASSSKSVGSSPPHSPVSPSTSTTPLPSYVLFTGRAKVTPPKTVTVRNSEGHFTSLPPPLMYDARAWTKSINASANEAITATSQHLTIIHGPARSREPQ
ncbi:uncharacterized protein STEHIDRAFT_165494 [Stereum hirsutum FP-91666 SS1]|uniref:uncharacterized protein n=1 Tax=Stereum hirsutum (strain FP-91666) TaxID=721885 RepID=UPI000440E1A3|nr:uncharacterized protein STEHIDRAFT_165494 [Stereum hirsutum FP-91666 SS1]EIM91094.1 hypothetical protein STEHIDRAFT_165494 [Stereum hirsutum FP-91666 SS1]